MTGTAAGTAYNGVAPVYDRMYSRPRDRAENAVLAHLAVGLGFHAGRVLDVACGTGLLLDLVGVPARGYVGIDASAAMLEVATEKHPHATFLQRDMADPVTYRGESGRWATRLAGGFSHLWCTFALELLTEEQVVSTLLAWREVLDPGGRILFTLPTIRHLHDMGPWTRVLVDEPVMQAWEPLAVRVFGRMLGGRPRVRGLGYSRTGRPWLCAAEFATLGRLWPAGADFLVVDVELPA